MEAPDWLLGSTGRIAEVYAEGRGVMTESLSIAIRAVEIFAARHPRPVHVTQKQAAELPFDVNLSAVAFGGLLNVGHGEVGAERVRNEAKIIRFSPDKAISTNVENSLLLLPFSPIAKLCETMIQYQWCPEPESNF